MKGIEIYLITEDNGLEAVEFYKEVFNATVVSSMTFGQANPNTSDDLKNLLMNAQLDINGIRLQISDNNPNFPYVVGTNMSAVLLFDNVEEATAIYQKLIKDATRIELELQETPWSPAYANVIDKFGMTWQINTEIEGFVSLVSF
ncbi:VOC family protein [Streptococcus uberis]|uniref:VOC family protein n=1 Tax=Streptococcus uberis TaxID=1349 RepID=UPI0012B5F49A|nr:VOC family protein [Streptococcus uberis]MTB57000.1 VOC family protein [Streptococcus uberis]